MYICKKDNYDNYDETPKNNFINCIDKYNYIV
jgi:hypothetical protein